MKAPAYEIEDSLEAGGKKGAAAGRQNRQEVVGREGEGIAECFS
jgi:hypothetical protein